jgi:acyl carrier protein
MTDIDSRLANCFRAVFPALPPDRVTTATPETVPGWDSIATATLLSLVSEEFGIPIDFEIVESLNSFRGIRDYVLSQS